MSGRHGLGGRTGWGACSALIRGAGQMAGLVSSCHAGLSLCRDDAGASLLAAMLTKIGEFLGSGRPVVVSPGQVDAAGPLERHGCGVVFGQSAPAGVSEAVDELELLLTDPGTLERCRSLAEPHFDLDRGVDRLVAAYGKLIA